MNCILRTKVLIVIFLMLTSALCLAQLPSAFSYQAVLRAEDGCALSSANVALRITIQSEALGGEVQYQEEHFSETDEYGLVQLEIGNGDVTASSPNTTLNLIDWGAADHFVEIELDEDGAGYTSVGMMQLLAVPYALYANKAGTASFAQVAQTVVDIDDDDADPSNELITSMVLEENVLQVFETDEVAQIDLGSLVDDADADPANELVSAFVLNEFSLELTEAGETTSINLESLVDDADADSANELITSMVLVETTLQVFETDEMTTINLESLVDDADADPSNELVSGLVLNGFSLELSEAGETTSVDLQTLVDDADADPSNELVSGLVLNDFSLELTEAGETTSVDLQTLVDDADADPTNELVSAFVLNEFSLELTEAGQTTTIDLESLVDDADADPLNELIGDASLVGTLLTIDQQGDPITVDFSALPPDDDWQQTETEIYNLTHRVGVGTTNPTSTFHANGSVSYAVRTLQGGTIELLTDADHILFCDNTDENIIVNLPMAAESPGRLYRFRTFGTAPLTGQTTFVGSNFNLINGGLSYTLDSLEEQTIELVSNGIQWMIMLQQ